MTRRGEDRASERQVSLPHAVAVELLTASITGFAARHGIRILSIKGQALIQQGLRAARESSDVDVLVDPAAFGRLWTLLRESGWTDRDKSVLVDLPEAGSVLAPHARTLEHAQWPCHLDLHRYYPGLLRPAQEVFDALWAARETVTIAHSTCSAPSPADHWVIAALHAARSHDRCQLDDLEGRASARIDSDFADLAARASVLGATGPLSDSLHAVLGSSPDIPQEEERLLQLWRRRLASENELPEALMEQFRSAGWLTRIRLAARKLVPSPRFAQAFFGVADDPVSLSAFYLRRAASAPGRLVRIIAASRERGR